MRSLLQLILSHLIRVPGYEDVATCICQDFEKRFKLYHAKAQEALGERYADVVKH